MYKNYNSIAYYILLIIIALSIISQTPLATTIKAMSIHYKNSKTLNYTITFNNPIINEINGYHIVSIPECVYITRPGEPFLPYKSIVIILPPDQTLDYIEVQWLEMHEIPGKYFIAPAPEPVTIDTSTDPVRPDRIIYNQSEPYPGTLYSYMPRVHMLRGYKFVIVALYPVHYIPSTGKIIFYSKFKITVHLKDDKLSIAKPTRHIINWLQKIALNPEMLHKYMIANSSSNGYLIITRPMFFINLI